MLQSLIIRSRLATFVCKCRKSTHVQCCDVADLPTTRPPPELPVEERKLVQKAADGNSAHLRGDPVLELLECYDFFLPNAFVDIGVATRPDHFPALDVHRRYRPRRQGSSVVLRVSHAHSLDRFAEESGLNSALCYRELRDGSLFFDSCEFLSLRCERRLRANRT